jgi:hypothetical protein
LALREAGVVSLTTWLVFLEEVQVPTKSKTGWAPHPVWTFWRFLGLDRIENQDHLALSLPTILSCTSSQMDLEHFNINFRETHNTRW